MLIHIQATLPNHWHAPPQTRTIRPNHWHRGILPNHWHAPPLTSISSKSLAHCQQTDNSAKSLNQGTGIVILLYHWHLACSCSTYRQFCHSTGTLSTDRHFCQITGTTLTNRQFCQITGTGNSAKSLAHSSTHIQAIQPNHRHTIHIHAILPNHWHRQFCQITGMLLNIQDILPNHWHAPPHHTRNSAKSLAHWPQTDRQFCQITGTRHAPPHRGNSAKCGTTTNYQGKQQQCKLTSCFAG
jgi:hypothetical protein